MEDDNDTFANGSDDNSVPHDEYATRDIHIVGEGDSIISHWTGYTGQRGKPSNENYEIQYNSGHLGGITTDVHQCSSATCEVCERNRQAGLHFISAGTNGEPIRIPSLPSDASREYPAEDTVEL